MFRPLASKVYAAGFRVWGLGLVVQVVVSFVSPV